MKEEIKSIEINLDEIEKEAQTTKPYKTLTLGKVKASAWKNNGKNGEFDSIKIQQIYKDKNNKWQTSNYLNQSNLADATILLQEMAKQKIREQ